MTPSTVAAALDPVAALLLDAVGYGGTPVALGDGQQEPGLRLRRQVTVAGAGFVVQHCVGARVVAEEPLPVSALPIDPTALRPRPRRHPAAQAPLTVAATPAGDGRSGGRGGGADVLDAADAGDAVVCGTGGAGDAHRVVVPATGPSLPRIDAIRAAAVRHRLVRLDPGPTGVPLTGDPLLWGGLVLRLVASGTVCLLPGTALDAVAGLSQRVRATLPADGSGSIDADVVAAVEHDDLALARVAAEQRRAALADHDLALTWQPGTGDGPWAPALRPRPVPTVSVLLTTRRPGLVPTALSMVAGQRGIALEVIIALHGSHDPGPAEAALRAADLPGQVLVVPGEVPFGAALNAAVERTSGDLVLKWDDDDLYGPHVVEDLVLAQRASGAALTGKAAEFVHLGSQDRTVWRTPARAEGPSMTLAGGTFLTPRSVLIEVGGYPPITRAVDHHLKARVAAVGGEVYRTHGFGFVLRRHGQGHTWTADDQRFLAQAVAVFDGVPAIVGVADAARFANVPVPPAPDAGGPR